MGVAEETVPGQRAVTFGTVAAGIVIGAVEVIFAVSFAALVFTGHLEFYFLDDGVGLYLAAAALTLAVMAWRAGFRGIVGGLQGTGAALMAIVLTSASRMPPVARKTSSLARSPRSWWQRSCVGSSSWCWGPAGGAIPSGSYRTRSSEASSRVRVGCSCGWSVRRLGGVVVLHSVERPLGELRMAALAPGHRVRRGPVPSRSA